MNNNRCVCCGEIIPSGRQVCWICEHKVMEDENDVGVFERAKDKASKEN